MGNNYSQKLKIEKNKKSELGIALFAKITYIVTEKRIQKNGGVR